MPVNEKNLPSTIKKSPAKAKRTYAKALESAEQQYGDGARARRTAMAALKHSFEKRGDHWEPKNGKGPSDPQAARSGAAARRGGKTAGGVDVLGSSREELYERARKLGVKGRSRMTKRELGEAISRRQ
jgi:cation transport regulator ChaB